MPKRRDGANPTWLFWIVSRYVSVFSPSNWNRRAVVGLSTKLASAVARSSPFVPSISAASLRGSRSALFCTWLITPPVDPRPKVRAAGPFSTSTCWMLKRSRLYSPMSRTPSRKRSPATGKPRSQKICDACTPPSAAVMVIPGTLRSASESDVDRLLPDQRLRHGVDELRDVAERRLGAG